jgi:superfamily II RNA helicase
MGLHLPAKSVVLADLKKFNGSSVEWLTATEYRQLTGRAGRRGIDVRGAAIFIVGPEQRFTPIARRLFGEPEALRSAFALRYNTFLNVYAPGAEERILLLLEHSLSRYQDVRALLKGRGEDVFDERSSVPDEGNRGRGRRRHGPRDNPRERQELEATLRAELARGDRRLVRSMRRILEQEGCLDRRGHLLLSGAVAARIYNSWGIAFAALLLDGTLQVLTPAELAEVTSWFIASKFSEPPPGAWRWRSSGVRSPYAAGLSPHLAAIADGITMNVMRLRQQELALEVELTPPWELPNHRFVRTWCEKGLLAPILEQTGAPPGDVLQVLGQTFDLIRQGQRALAETVGPDDPADRLLEHALSAISSGGKLLQLLGL